MKLIKSLANINHTLNELIKNDEYTSIGYIPVLNIITPNDIVAIKKAQRLLDIIIVHNISNNNFDEFSLKTINQINPNLIIDLITDDPSNINVSFYLEQLNSFSLIKAILSILPSSVFINQDNFIPFKAISIFNDNFPNLFSIHNVSTPENLKSYMDLETIDALKILEKKNAPYTVENLSKLLPDLKIHNLNSYENSQGLFVNVLIKDTETGLESSVTYLCRK